MSDPHSIRGRHICPSLLLTHSHAHVVTMSCYGAFYTTNLCVNRAKTFSVEVYITTMSDSSKNLTESLIAHGKTLQGNGAEYMCRLSKAGFPCAECERITWVLDLKQHWAGLPEHFPTRFQQELIDHQTHIDRYNPPSPIVRKKNRHALGPREFTLTYSPKWFDSDADARYEMCRALHKLMMYYRSSITRLRAVGETGTNGRSHIHCYYELEGGKKITDKNFKRAWSYWDPSEKHGDGFKGGHHATVEDTANFLGYIDKEIDTAWLDEKIER